MCLASNSKGEIGLSLGKILPASWKNYPKTTLYALSVRIYSILFLLVLEAQFVKECR